MALDPSKVSAVQTLLTELGFWLFRPEDKNQENEWFSAAIREFQIYARLPTVAVVQPGAAPENWIDNLKAAGNSAVYPGKIDGIFSNDVDTALKHWSINKYRCPVVVDLYIRTSTAKWPPLECPRPRGNYWRWDDERIRQFVAGRVGTPEQIYDAMQVRVFDFTKSAPGSPAILARAGRLKPWSVPLPYRPQGNLPKKKYPRRFVGSALQDWRTMQENVEVLPQTLIGKQWNQASPAAKSTFRVIRAVAEQECWGYFDAINGYDNAGLSLGLFHWTLSVGEKLPDIIANPTDNDVSVSAGELNAFLAVWKMLSPADAARAFETPFGVTVKPQWKIGDPGSSPGWSATRTYAGQIVLPGSAATVTKAKELSWFRTSHWFWRMVQLARTEESFRRAQWTFARLRLRDVLAFPFDPTQRPGVAGTGLPVPLSRIFKSEKTVALLIRCHVRSPSFITAKGFATGLPFALLLSGIPPQLDVASWGRAQQEALANGILAVTALGDLTSSEAKQLKGLAAKELAEKLAKMAASRDLGPGAKRLRDECRAVADWPQKNRFVWNHKTKLGRDRVPFSLEQVACDPLSVEPTFALDESDLPPMPAHTG